MRRLGVEELPVGALIGYVSVSEIEPLTPIRWRELDEHHLDTGVYQPGLFAWHVVEPTALKAPIPYRGDRGLFTVECEGEWDQSPVVR